MWPLNNRGISGEGVTVLRNSVGANKRGRNDVQQQLNQVCPEPACCALHCMCCRQISLSVRPICPSRSALCVKITNCVIEILSPPSSSALFFRFYLELDCILKC